MDRQMLYQKYARYIKQRKNTFILLKLFEQEVQPTFTSNWYTLFYLQIRLIWIESKVWREKLSYRLIGNFKQLITEK